LLIVAYGAEMPPLPEESEPEGDAYRSQWIGVPAGAVGAAGLCEVVAPVDVGAGVVVVDDGTLLAPVAGGVKGAVGATTKCGGVTGCRFGAGLCAGLWRADLARAAVRWAEPWR
jgi:hypothetical protein